jgi:heterotetrameric sarcosine oxidase gamma subunit
VSAPERRPPPPGAAAVEIARLAADVVEVAALRHQARELASKAGRRGLALPATGRVAATRGQLALCVRPERWLLLVPPAAPGVSAAEWQAESRGCAAAVDLSSALAKLVLSGAAVRELLARGCRLDLDPESFTAGRAAATFMAQVPVILAALPKGLLLLTPATTGQHLHEWLASSARPFGLTEAATDATVRALCGDEVS